MSKITIDMLGGLQVRVGDTVLLQDQPKINKPWQVLCLLAMNKGTPLSASRLIDTLWEGESLTDAGNVLKNTIYALRREFKNLEGAAANPVLFGGGGYMISGEVEVEVDALRLEELGREALTLTGEARIERQMQAVALYKGRLLPQLGGEGWVDRRAEYYYNLYKEIVNDLCEALYQSGRYSELLAEATAAGKIDQLEESYYLHIMRALYALGMYKVMVPLYQRAQRLLSHEAGRSLGEDIRTLYIKATEQVGTEERDIVSICDDLQEVTGEDSPPSAPLYCTYDVFKYLYQMVARTSERTGALILIILVTLQEKDGGPPEAEKLGEAMDLIRGGLLGGLLRKSDTVARYSPSQYIIMLASDQNKGHEPVIQRLEKRLAPALAKSGLRLHFSTTALGGP